MNVGSGGHSMSNVFLSEDDSSHPSSGPTAPVRGAEPCRAESCCSVPPPPAPLLSSSGSARSSVPHPARSCRHVLKQAGYQPHDKSIGLFCNVIYIKASGAAGLKRSKMFSKSLSCLCLGGAINSTARTHQPSVPPSLSSATKGLSRRFFFSSSSQTKLPVPRRYGGGDGKTHPPHPDLLSRDRKIAP